MSARPEPDYRQQPQRRYPSEPATDPTDRSDPHTTEDETASSWREKLSPSGKRKIVVIAGVAAAFAFTAYVALLLGGSIIALLKNTYVQAALGALALVAVGLVTGAKRERATVAETDDLSVKLPQSGLDMPGEYVELDQGPGFVPYKGRRGLLRSMETFTEAELADEYPNLVSKERDSDDTAVILLWEPFTSVVQTDRGTKVKTLADGFEGTPHHSTATLKATPPTLAGERQLEEANAMIEELENDVDALRRLVDSYENRLDDVLGKLDDSRDDVRTELKQDFKELMEATAVGRRDRRTGTRQNGQSNEEPPWLKPGDDE